jgi:hypothetical protein
MHWPAPRGSPEGHARTTSLSAQTAGNRLLGARCAQGRIDYESDGVLWHIFAYEMNYTVSGPLSFGANNNENPSKIDQGFERGTQTFLSADSGSANVGWFTRSGYGNGYSFKGESHITIDAFADIPGAADPDLKLQTSDW